MIRTVLFASAIALAAPALAQEMPTQQPTDTPTPAPAQDQVPPADATPTQSAPAEAAPTTPAPTTPADAAQPAQQPAAGPAQVAQVVEADFPSFDRDGDGELTEAEFTEWMTKLRTASGDATPQEELKTWATAAFAQADTDKSQSVNKAELTQFLAG